MKHDVFLNFHFYTNGEKCFQIFFWVFFEQVVKLLPDLHEKPLSLAAASACLRIFSSPEGILQQHCLEQAPHLNNETYLVQQIKSGFMI